MLILTCHNNKLDSDIDTIESSLDLLVLQLCIISYHYSISIISITEVFLYTSISITDTVTDTQ